MGLAAIIGLARRQGFVEQAWPILDALRMSGYFISHDVVSAILDSVGEARPDDAL